MKRISSGSTFEQEIGYCRAVADGDYVHVSGTTGYNYDTMTLPEDVVAQAEQALTNIEDALTKAGSDLSRVIRVRYIFPNRTDFPPCKPVFARVFASHPPAATLIVADLLDPAMKVEIEVTAKQRAD